MFMFLFIRETLDIHHAPSFSEGVYMLSRLIEFLVYFIGYSLFVFLFGFIGISFLMILFKLIMSFGNISMKDVTDVLSFNLYGFSRLSPLIVLSILISKKLRSRRV